MSAVKCAECGGTGGVECVSYRRPDGLSWHADCEACGGSGHVDLAKLADEKLYPLRDGNEATIDAEAMRRGCVAWVLDCTDTVMPGTREDIAECGCELVQWITKAASAA